MAQTKLGDLIVNTSGNLPAIGTPAPDFRLAKTDMSETTLKDYAGQQLILNIFPSIDTRVCAMSVREFNKRVASLDNTVVLCIAKDLPFAFKRFCGAEGIENVISLSDFRNKGFAKAYGVDLLDGPFEGLHARAIVVIDEQGKVKHTELVSAIGNEPDYKAAIASLR
ncbi:MAG TPA: thiol peroxidase [Chryseosolibacter sp.]|nr:thiol peroxidase [Chryseosolibacter sp.]